jgi:hypothetical protein
VARGPTPEEYRGLARHIRRKAEPLSNSGAREEMLHIAEQYEELADLSEAKTAQPPSAGPLAAAPRQPKSPSPRVASPQGR